MEYCPQCGSEVYVHETELIDQIYCQECGFEQERKLTKPRPMTVVEEGIPAGWSWDKGQKESHPARKGFRKKQEGKRRIR